jgi:hypothetical protein
MSVIRTTTCALCGVDLEVRRMKGPRGWYEIPPMSVRYGPKDPNGHWSTCCEPDGPSHKEVK